MITRPFSESGQIVYHNNMRERKQEKDEMTPAVDNLEDRIADAIFTRIQKFIQPTDIERLWNVKQVARYLGRTEASVRGMIASGEIPAAIVRRFNDRVFVERKALVAWVDAR